MFSKASNALKSLNIRLTAVFSVTFIFFTLTMFFASYHLLGTALLQDENTRIRRTALRFWALYQTYGNELLTEELFREEFLENSQSLIRVAAPDNTTMLLYFPEDFSDFDLNQLDRTEAGESPRKEVLISAEANERYLRVLTVNLPDGTILQIGLDVTNRVLVLRQFRFFFPVMALPFLFLSIAGGLIFSRNALRPIHSLIATTKNIIETGKMKSRIPTRGTGDELDELVALFNRMIENIDNLISGMRFSLDNVAHDLRTPLTRLRGKAEAALENAGYGPEEDDENTPQTERQRPGKESRGVPAVIATLRSCVEEASRIQSMLALVMDISEAETGHMKLNLTDCDLSAVLEDMGELYEYAAEDKGLSLSLDIEPGLVAEVDETRFRQVIANLLDNAVKYTPPEGGITLTAERRSAGLRDNQQREPEKLPSGEALIRVEDSGIGMLPEELPFIWNRLYRCDRSRSEPGMGLGLSLVKAVVEAHGGAVSVSSTVNSGSSFTVTFPLKR